MVHTRPGPHQPPRPTEILFVVYSLTLGARTPSHLSHVLSHRERCERTLSHVHVAWCTWAWSASAARSSCLFVFYGVQNPKWMRLNCQYGSAVPHSLIRSPGVRSCYWMPAFYRKAPIGVEYAFCLTPSDEDSHSATIVPLCFAIVCVCVSLPVCLPMGAREHYTSRVRVYAVARCTL